MGPPGPDGASGADGSLPTITTLPPGDTCDYGGVRIDATEPKVICNGAPGESFLVTTAGIEPGPACEGGGLLVATGADDGQGGGVAGDGTLQSGEVRDSHELCATASDVQESFGGGGGCSVVSSAPARTSWWWSVSLAALAVLRRRRGAQREPGVTSGRS
jgi:MYXO-CTERM domain-containing protein